MDKNQIFDQLVSTISDVVGYSEKEITPECNLRKDLGFDSFDELELLVEIERNFNIEILDTQTEGIETVQQIQDLLATLIK